jgi:hypothetical protein
MNGMTLEEAQQQLSAWMAASLAVALSQEYTIGTRKLRKADASEIRIQIEFWEARVARLTAVAQGRRPGRRITYGVPR